MADVSAKAMAALVSERIGIDVDPKAFRRFVREYMRAKGAGDALPGRGGAYVFDAEQADVIADAYASWRARSGVARITFDVTTDDDDE